MRALTTCRLRSQARVTYVIPIASLSPGNLLGLLHSACHKETASRFDVKAYKHLQPKEVYRMAHYNPKIQSHLEGPWHIFNSLIDERLLWTVLRYSNELEISEQTNQLKITI